MAAGKDADENTHNRRGTVCSMVIRHEEPLAGSPAGRPPVIFNPDFFVEKLRHENPEVFLELVISNVTRLIDLPGTEFAQLLGEEGPKTPTGGNGGFFRSLNFLKRKDKGIVFGSPLTDGCIAQIYQLVEFLSRHLHVEGLFRVPGNSVRQQTLKELLNSGADVDLHSGDFHPNDVATLLKTFLGELPEPLLTHKHFNAHLKIADMTLFDEHGNKTAVPNKERQIEALQLLFLLLPQANRSLLKLLLDLLYHTAKLQDKNKMSAHNLALMFAPHVLWPRHDDLELLAASSSPAPRTVLPLKRSAALAPPSQEACGSPAQQYTDEALKELFRHVHQNMPDSAKKKKLVRQLVKQTNAAEDPQAPPPASRKHPRSRSFGGLIKRRTRGEQLTAERRVRHASPEAVSRTGRKGGKENVVLQAVHSPFSGALMGKSGLVVRNPDFEWNKDKAVKPSKESPSESRMCPSAV
uniref:Rho GTPase-activating protein 19 n=1 Tax=Oryzias latipes TaxID=8090 RepID=A0A3P9JRJ9_ORYLA